MKAVEEVRSDWVMDLRGKNSLLHYPMGGIRGLREKVRLRMNTGFHCQQTGRQGGQLLRVEFGLGILHLTFLLNPSGDSSRQLGRLKGI